MTGFVLGASMVIGAIATFCLFFQIDELGWAPFFGCLVGTAVVSVLTKIFDMTLAALNNSVTAINQLNSIQATLAYLRDRSER